MWCMSAILTAVSVFTDNPEAVGYGARADAKVKAIEESKWIRVPYPREWKSLNLTITANIFQGIIPQVKDNFSKVHLLHPVQYGIPTVSAAAVISIMSGILASIVESVGDYHACARLIGASSPPVHAINRGENRPSLKLMYAQFDWSVNWACLWYRSVLSRMFSWRCRQYPGRCIWHGFRYYLNEPKHWSNCYHKGRRQFKWSDHLEVNINDIKYCFSMFIFIAYMKSISGSFKARCQCKYLNYAVVWDSTQILCGFYINTRSNYWRFIHCIVW